MTSYLTLEDFPAVKKVKEANHACEKNALQSFTTNDYLAQALCTGIQTENLSSPEVQNVFSALYQCNIQHLTEFFDVSRDTTGTPHTHMKKPMDTARSYSFYTTYANGETISKEHVSESFSSLYHKLDDQQDAEMHGMIKDLCANFGIHVEL
ncbi:MAG: hypothetical protein KBC27_00715 [Rickettsiales bacterium]|nr:hypothetical protein [Rickettsiales bacterium]